MTETELSFRFYGNEANDAMAKIIKINFEVPEEKYDYDI